MYFAQCEQISKSNLLRNDKGTDEIPEVLKVRITQVQKQSYMNIDLSHDTLQDIPTIWQSIGDTAAVLFLRFF